MADPLQPQHDLLGRWLAHRDSSSDDAGPSAPEPAPAPAPSPPVAPVSAAPTAPAGRHRGEPGPETPPAPEGASLREAVTAAVLSSLEPTPAAHAERPDLEPAPDTDTAQPSAPTPAAVRADHVFAPRRGTRRLLSAVTAAAAAVTVWALLQALAAPEPDSTDVGLVLIAAVATLTLWAVRAGAAPARLRVQLGQLEVVRGSRRDVVDLAGDYTAVEVQGRPGRRGWRVVFPRREGESLVVDASMVDPQEFMRVLRAYRPDVDRQRPEGAGVSIQ